MPEPDAPVSPAPDDVAAHAGVAAAVFASDESNGRERMAADFMSHAPNASAEQVIAFLAKQPKPGAQAADDQATLDAQDRAAGEQMLAASVAAGNADLGSGTAAEPNPKATSADVWAKARTAARK